MDLSIVIVSTDEAHFLQPCLESLWHGTAGVQCEVFVVDNACEDDTAAITREVLPDATIIRNESRYGFARSNNAALRVAGGRYLLVLNPDTEVREGALKTLVSYLDEHEQVGIAGARLLNPDGTLQYSCRKFPSLRSVVFRWLPLCPNGLRERMLREYMMMDWDHASPRAVDWLMGACLCVRRAATEEVGFFDEEFRLYYEDIDWCYRMWQHGWEVHYVPDAIIMHHYQRTSAQRLFSRALWTHVRSCVRFFAKHRLLRL
jgi:GT2 family glycosyltransferase